MPVRSKIALEQGRTRLDEYLHLGVLNGTILNKKENFSVFGM
jgi:hypothetical protein